MTVKVYTLDEIIRIKLFEGSFGISVNRLPIHKRPHTVNISSIIIAKKKLL